ncbi:MAG TPA: hypothetical protein ENO03_06015 [Candidatus Aminicenantes bacterium]|nr:hypothetical protein [Candidatus Aminicenantes bacterium]
MRTYNIFLCPKCLHFEYRRAEAFGHEKKGPGKLFCHAGAKPEEIRTDPKHTDPLRCPPPPCEDFELKVKK